MARTHRRDSFARRKSSRVGMLGALALLGASIAPSLFGLEEPSGILIYGPPLPPDFETAKAPAAPADTPSEIPVLRVVQKARGIPDARGESTDREVEQMITVSDDGGRILLEQYDPARGGDDERRLESRVILRLDRDPPVAWEIGPDGKSYREHAGDLNKIQEERQHHEREVVRKASRRPPRELEEILRQRHLRLDGERKVEVRWGETSEAAGSSCRQLVVTENGRTIIDACISEEAAGGQSFFQLYRRLGAFSEEVLQAIRNVRGLPLRGSITVVTKLPVYTFEFEVETVERTKTRSVAFDLPKDARKIIDTPAIVECPTCKKEVETARGQMFEDRARGRTLYFCDNVCLSKYKRALLEGGFRRGETPAGGQSGDK